MSKIFKFLGIFIFSLAILVAGGGYFFLKTFDLNKYKPYIEDLVEKQIGRKLLIKGDASVAFSLIPTVEIADVELANASWAAAPQMVEVKRIELKMALLPLLEKKISIHRLTLIEPQIYLQTNAHGKGNWEFDIPQKKVGYKLELISSAYAEDDKISIPDLSLKNISILNGLVKYNKDDMKIVNLTLSIPTPNDLISSEFDVSYNSQVFKGVTTLGSVNSLLADNDYTVLLGARAIGVDLNFDGKIQKPLSSPLVIGKLNLYNPAGNQNAPETSLETNLQASAKSIVADIALLNIANNQIKGKISVDLGAKIPQINAKLNSNLINLETLQVNKPLAFDFPELISSANATAFVPATPIDVQALKSFNANVDLSIGKLVVSKAISANSVLLKVHLQSGVLAVAPLKLNFGNGEVDCNAQFNASTQTLTVNLNSKNLSLQDFHKEFAVENEKDFGVINGGKMDLTINLVGRGDTYRQLVSSLDGRVTAIVAKSTIQTGNLSFMTNNFISSLVAALNYNKNKKTILDLNCAVVRGDFVNGKINFPKGIAIQSKELSLVSDGYVNLNNDKIDLAVRPFSGKVLDANVAQAVSNFIKVKGSLQEPKLVLDEKEAIKAIVGVVSTGGASYLGSKLVLDADSSPCYTALRGTGYENRFPAPAKTQEVYQDASKKVEDDLKLLKNTAKDFLKNFK